MSIKLLVHISNQEPVKVDVDELPGMTDVAIIGKNPRDRADKEITWIDEGVTSIILPWWRINFIQILPNEDDGLDFPLPFRTD